MTRSRRWRSEHCTTRSRCRRTPTRWIWLPHCSARSSRRSPNGDRPNVEQVERPGAYLVDDRAKIAHPLAPPSTSIGRDASNEIVIRDPSASRFHAEIKQEAGSFVLHSIGATGTLLNAKPLSEPQTLTE